MSGSSCHLAKNQQQKLKSALAIAECRCQSQNKRCSTELDNLTHPCRLLERARRVRPSHLEDVLHGVPELGEGEELGRAVLDGRHGNPLVRTRRGPALARLATRKLLPVDIIH